MTCSVQIEQEVVNVFRDFSLEPLIHDTPTHKLGNTLGNILTTSDGAFVYCQVRRDLQLSYHYPIILRIDSRVLPINTKQPTRYCFNQAQHLEKFLDSWKFFAFEDSPNTNDVTRFYEFLWSGVKTNFKQKRRKRTANPFFYSSLTMHTLNKLNRMRKKIARNPSKTNLSRLSELEIEFREFSEMDKICFINGSMTSNLSDCFALLRSLKSSDYPKIMFFDQERLENPVDIANGFNKFFAKNFNTGSYTGVAYSSSEFISLKDFKFSIRPDLILIEIMRIKLSTYPTVPY